MEELKQKVNEVYNWTVEDGKPKPPKQDLPLDEVLENLKQLDEPKTLKVPQEIADEIEYYKKKDGYGLFCAMDHCYDKHKNWFNSNEETFARAWLDGYEVEKEKRYVVKMKGLVQTKSYLNFNFGGVWLFYNEDDFDGYRSHHTRKELEEAGFGWVFSCEGIEVEEVE